MNKGLITKITKKKYATKFGAIQYTPREWYTAPELASYHGFLKWAFGFMLNMCSLVQAGYLLCKLVLIATSRVNGS